MLTGRMIDEMIRGCVDTIEGIPRNGEGYEVTGIKGEAGSIPIIEVEMHPTAFREAIGYLNRPGFAPLWMEKNPMLKKKKPVITKVIYNPPATIVWFNDGDKVVSKAEEGDEFDWETGLAICVLKKRMDRNEYNKLQPYFFAPNENNTKLLWETLVRMNCPNGEWEKIKKEWGQK